MPLYCRDKAIAAQCVEDTLTHLDTDWPWTMIIKPDSFAGYSVQIVIDTWSEDTAEKLRQFLKQPTNI